MAPCPWDHTVSRSRLSQHHAGCWCPTLMDTRFSVHGDRVQLVLAGCVDGPQALGGSPDAPRPPTQFKTRSMVSAKPSLSLTPRRASGHSTPELPTPGPWAASPRASPQAPQQQVGALAFLSHTDAHCVGGRCPLPIPGWWHCALSTFWLR
jgi:hypothetical protein